MATRRRPDEYLRGGGGGKGKLTLEDRKYEDDVSNIAPCPVNGKGLQS